MPEATITPLPDPSGFASDPLTELVCNGARKLIEQALEAELAALLAAHAEEKTVDGRTRLVRHGHLPERNVLTQNPKLVIGDGALGFWAALREVFATTQEQRCWLHKTMNVLNAMPKSVQPKARGHLHDIWQAETRQQAEAAFDLFFKTYGVKYDKAAAKLAKDRNQPNRCNMPNIRGSCPCRFSRTMW